MTSAINPFTIDQTYPIAGQDNDTQGFRDNFIGIQNNFKSAKSEIEALQNTSISSGPAVTNDLIGGVIKNAEFRDNSLTVSNKGIVSGTVTFDHEDGHIQSFTTGGNVLFAFTNFPVTSKYGRILVEANVTSGWNLSFPSEVILPPDFVVTVDGNGTYWYEFISRDNGVTIHLFDRTRSYGANTGDINISGNTISTVSTNTNLVLLPNGTGDVQLGTQIIVDGNTITTLLTNANLNLNTSGSGVIELLSPTNITGNTSITGTLSVTGTLSSAAPTFTGLMHRSLTNTIVAGATQTQAGATLLTSDINRVTTSGTNGDGVKLPSAISGLEVLIINNDTTQTIQIWPNTGDSIDGGAVNTADPNLLISGKSRRYISTDTGNWYTSQAPGGINNIIEDPTPQLGAPLDTNNFAIDESEATAVASSDTTNIWATTGNTIHVTGTTTITSFGTAPKAGSWRKVIFDGILLLTDGANLNLPGSSNITTAVDDFAFVYADTTTLFKILYFKSDGTAIVGGGALSNIVEDTTPQLGGPLDTFSQAIDESEATAVASATTTNIWATTGNTIHVTGTTTITSFGTAPRVGAWRKVIFDGILTLTDGANLNLPGSSNITTAVDDFAFVYADTTTLFKVLYFRDDGKSVTPTITGLNNVVEDLSPQLGSFLDTNGFAIDESEGAAVASASTTNIWSLTGNTVHITGTTTITSFGPAPRIGAWRKVIFDGILTLTDGADLNLPGGANITTAVDDFAFVYADTTTLFKVLYFKVDGTALIGLSNLVEDITPQLGGALDTNGFAINESREVVASAATTDIWVTTGSTVNITGTTTITSFGTAPNIGAWRKVVFNGILTLQNSVNLNIPGAANIITALDDFALVFAAGTSVFEVLYFPRGGILVNGPTSAVDNAVPRYNGTTGHNIQSSGLIIDDDNNLSGHGAQINAQTGTTYTLTGTDNGKIVTLDNAAAITLTLPQTTTESIAQGFQCAIVQKGVGQVTVAKEGTDTILSKNSNLKLSAQGVVATIVKTTAGSPNAWLLGGDLVA